MHIQNTMNLLAHRDYVPGELMLSPSRWRERLLASASGLAQFVGVRVSTMFSFQRCASSELCCLLTTLVKLY